MEQITIKLILDNGSEITAYTDKSELAKLNEPQRPRTGYERVNNGGVYYAININGVTEYYANNDKSTFNRGNYINDKQLCQDRFRAKTLFNKMEQWQALNDNPVDWSDVSTPNFLIAYDYSRKLLYVDFYRYSRAIGGVYFSTKEKAKEAIEVFRDELIWYFTEYRSRLDEKRTKC